MTTLRFRPLLLAVTIALLAGTGVASAGTYTSHWYCPRGASIYWGIFGYWCEDGTLSGVQPYRCKSGPGQARGTWNDSSLTPDQLCMQQNSTEPEPVSVIPWDIHFK
jgi:hypothetical protein